MNKLWVTAATAILLSACGSQIVEQSKFDIAQRRQIGQENAEKEARVREEQQELERQRERQRQRDEAAKRAAQSEVPVVRPLETDSLHEKVLASDRIKFGTARTGCEARALRIAAFAVVAFQST